MFCLLHHADAFTYSGVSAITLKSLTPSTIGTYAFSYCPELTSVTVPATGKVESIGAYAFSYCPSLKTLNIEGTVGIIGTCTFHALPYSTPLPRQLLLPSRVTPCANPRTPH